MTDPDTIDGDVYVSPRYLAGSTGTGDPALEPLLALGWELRYDEFFERLSQSRTIAVDMESATIATNGFLFRVPYGTLLCVSDKPLHGELKLRGSADLFYRQRVEQHLLAGLEAIRLLREQGPDRLHSRKLRSFDEPAFR